MYVVFLHVQTPLGLKPWGVAHYKLRDMTPRGHKKHWTVLSIPEPVKILLARRAQYSKDGLVGNTFASDNFMVALWWGDPGRLAMMRLASHGSQCEFLTIRTMDDCHLAAIQKISDRYKHHGTGGMARPGDEYYGRFVDAIGGMLADVTLTPASPVFTGFCSSRLAQQ